MAKKRAKRAMPTWIKGDKTTKSGGGKIIKGNSPKKTTGGVTGFRPGDTSLKAVFVTKRKKKSK
jgi:hypothetical protein